jgi:hypothetical protein
VRWTTRVWGVFRERRRSRPASSARPRPPLREHLLASLFVGVLGAFAVSESERRGSLWYVGFMVLIAVGIYTLGVLGVFAVELKGLTDWPTVIVGTASWLLAVTAYLLRAHRRLLSRLRRDIETG